MTKDTNKRFGEKTLELFDLMEKTPDWEKYVSEKTGEIITFLKETQSMKETEDFFGEGGEPMPYITIRSHILKAIDRIKHKKTTFRQGGRSAKSKELFRLMEITPNWEEYVTHYEAELAKKYREVKSFSKLGEELNIAPSNIAGTLYGSTQKLGVIGKIKEGVPQSERRDFTVLAEDKSIEDLNAE
ncbi:gp517 [Bacillus phage G]|uniref:Gp517 n=1 Tax=Bacillus phage G TaxID=2884420 RepID=G3MAQ8_9CAUD|nr:gp517 [Bacillus phage G]AEO93775.1 gp517 [Bacillus phage G]